LKEVLIGDLPFEREISK